MYGGANGRQSDKGAFGNSQLKNKSYMMNNMNAPKAKSNNSMLNALPNNEGKKLIGEQSDIIARRHKISGSGGLASPAVQKLAPTSQQYPQMSSQEAVFKHSMGGMYHQRRNSRASKSR